MLVILPNLPVYGISPLNFVCCHRSVFRVCFKDSGTFTVSDVNFQSGQYNIFSRICYMEYVYFIIIYYEQTKTSCQCNMITIVSFKTGNAIIFKCSLKVFPVLMCHGRQLKTTADKLN